MRKWLLCIVVVLCLAVSVSAAETMTLEDAGITLTVPDGYDVLYRDMPEGHPILEKYGQTTESLNEMLSASDLTLMAIQSDYGTPTVTLHCTSVDDESPTEYAWIGGGNGAACRREYRDGRKGSGFRGSGYIRRIADGYRK